VTANGVGAAGDMVGSELVLGAGWVDRATDAAGFVGELDDVLALVHAASVARASQTTERALMSL
jgi:hypothetical protein